MDLGAIKTGLESWLGVVARYKRWEDGVWLNDPLPVEYGRLPKKVHTQPFVLVYLGPIGKIGWDFPRYTHDPLTDEHIEQMRGVRKMPIRFSFRAFSGEWEKNARQVAEDFRNDLHGTPSLDALVSSKLTLERSSDLVESDYEYSGRLVSQVDMTVQFGACGYQRNGAYDAGYIKSVLAEWQGQVIDEQSTPIEDESGNPVVVEDVITINVTTE